ncbi:dTDP-4-dehydrorhamnose 3,5-epimerase [Amylibacter sp.]|nr:dTDP-4-dehydrorhamnose 3,5-epimerase [Amylibacter sp.]
MTNYISNISGVLITPIDIISVPGGNVLHGIKRDDVGYSGFGEAYFSAVDAGAIKAWKRHREMTMNLIVPVGSIRFVIYDDRASKSSDKIFQQVILSREKYFRLTVPPMVWMGFQGLGFEENMLLNVSNTHHSVDEVDRLMVNDIKFDWGSK